MTAVDLFDRAAARSMASAYMAPMATLLGVKKNTVAVTGRQVAGAAGSPRPHEEP